MGKIMICPSCKNEVEVKKIRTGDRISYKYMNFVKAVGVCPSCLSEIHIPEIDEIVERLQYINKEYVNILKEYDDSTTSVNKDFSKDWETIEKDRLIFESGTDPFSSVTRRKLLYNGSLKNEFGYDIVTIDEVYEEELDNIVEFIVNHEDETGSNSHYYFKTFVFIGEEIREVCCMMWKDLEEEVSGIIFNKDDTNSYRYGKQKTRDKYVIV